EHEFNDGNYIFIINGVPKNWGKTGQMLSVAVWVGLCSSSGYVAPIEFIFRYVLVVKGRVLKMKELLGMALVVAMLGTISGVFIYLSCDAIPDQGAAFGYIMSNPMWINGDGTNNAFFKIFVVIVMVCDTVIVAVIVTSSAVTLKVLGKLRNQMTDRTRYMQTQLNRLMSAEVISLMVVVVIPFTVAMMCLILRVRFVGLGIFVGIVVTWIPTVNPVTTILLVGPYRTELFGRFGIVKKRMRNYNSVSDTTKGVFSLPSQPMQIPE
ncbi:hypothetical protein AAVH_31550, partial [Aphelenchoides avenae]